MNSIIQRIGKIIISTVAAWVMCWSVCAETVYDNTSSKNFDGSWFNPGTEFGDQVTLAGTGRIVTEISIGLFNAVTDLSANFRMYSNDGIGGAPGTMLYDTGPIPLDSFPGYSSLSLCGMSIPVKNSVTWTVSFDSIDPLCGGLVFGDPPSVGSSSDDYWVKLSDGSWQLNHLPSDLHKVANFVAAIVATDGLFPDLLVSKCQAPTNAIAGTPIQISWAVTNQGTATAVGPWNEAIYFSTNENCARPRLIKKYSFTNNLAAGESVDRIQTFIVPTNISGLGSFMVIVNDDNQVQEFSGGFNNVGVADDTTMVAPVENNPPEVVYDSMASLTNCALMFVTSRVTYGDEVVLAGVNRTISQLKFGYYLSNNISRRVKLSLALYANDGSQGEPGTRLWFYEMMPVSTGYNYLTIESPRQMNGNIIIAPEKMTWAATFSGIASNDCAGVLVAADPAVGANEPSFWVGTSNNWHRETAAGTSGVFAAQITAVPDGGYSTVKVETDPFEAGLAYGDGDYTNQALATVVAYPLGENLPYRFVNWTERGVIRSTDQAYRFYVDHDQILTANFAPHGGFWLGTTINPVTGGMVAGGGGFMPGTTNVLVATPNAGYHFIGWTENGGFVSTNAALPVVLYYDRCLVANFEPFVHMVSISTFPPELARIEGSGVYSNGQSFVLQAPAMMINDPEVYSFHQWTLNGAVLSAFPTITNDFTFLCPEQMNLVAQYEPAIRPRVVKAEANFQSPVPATSNLVFTIQFDHAMGTLPEPLLVLSNAAGVVQPIIPPGGMWLTVAFPNDTYQTPPIALTPGMDGTNILSVSLAQEANGVPLLPMNVLSLLIDATPPVISSITVSLAPWIATVGWATDEPATSRIQYGLSTNFGMNLTLNAGLKSDPSVTLPKLLPGSTYNFRIIARDAAGNESVSSNQTFTAAQVQPDENEFELSIGSTNILVGESNSVAIALSSHMPLTNISAILRTSTIGLGSLMLTPIFPEVEAIRWETLDSNLYRVNMTLNPSVASDYARPIALLGFSSEPLAHSAIVRLAVSQLEGLRVDGEATEKSATANGRVIIVGSQPVLETWRGTNSPLMATLFGNPGSNYQINYVPNINSTNWQSSRNISMVDRLTNISLVSELPTAFYQVSEVAPNPLTLKLDGATASNCVLKLTN